MYHALLTRRYLSSKIMPLLAALAVVLCTAMVLITWSVMGGFLNMLIGSGRTLIGDISITMPNTGFPYYDDLVRRLEADPLVAAAAPLIETYGLLSLPGSVPIRETVSVKGIDGPSYDRVTGYGETLWWRWLDEPLPKDTEGRDPRVLPDNRALLGATEAAGLTMAWREPDAAGDAGDVGEEGARPERPAAVLGIEINRYNHRQPGGWITTSLFMPGNDVTLSVLAMDRRGGIVDQATRRFPVANEFRSGIYEIDANTVLVPLAVLQQMLKMDEAKRVAPGTGAFKPVTDPTTGRQRFAGPEVVGIDPARVTSVVVRGTGDGKAEALATLKAQVEQVYDEFAKAHENDEVAAPSLEEVIISTWEERNATLIGAVKKETALVLFIFSFISLTAVFLVLAIFWSMISEKTKDVGILRSLGASTWGVAWLWLRYGLAIGLVGSLLGVAAAYAIVWNINPIHDWLGSALGIYVWDPAVYYFTTIPNLVDPAHAAMVLAGGVLSSVVGALVPALRAANMDPVRALRFE